MDFEKILAGCKGRTCIISVEKFSDGSYGNIRIPAANRAHCEDIEQNFHHPFIPDSPYTQSLPQDKNFEDFMYRSACLGQMLHTYVHLEHMGLWVNMFLLPLESDRENIGYCLYSYDLSPYANSEQQASLAANTAPRVLETCIKLRGTENANIRQVFLEIIEDIRQMCGADHCCILLADREAHQYQKFCEAVRPEGSLLSINAFLDKHFFEIADTFDATIGQSSCVIIKDAADMNWLASVNPGWHTFLTEAGVNSAVLFPLKHNSETLGYLWALNFHVEDTVKIKEILELTTFFIASEIANYLLMRRLERLSSIDLLTGCKNRNAMNNTIHLILNGKMKLTEPYAVIFVDLNGLKHINDEKGHSAGDLLLRTASAILSQVFFDCDVYRAGGDEFMLLAEGYDEEMLKCRLHQLNDRACAATDVHFAVGYCFVSENEDIRSALRIADEKMYIDKKSYYEQHPERKYR